MNQLIVIRQVPPLRIPSISNGPTDSFSLMVPDECLTVPDGFLILMVPDGVLMDPDGS